MRWLWLLVVACHPAPAPAPVPVVVAPPPAKPMAPPAKVSCADAGVILRGSVEDSRKAGPAKEAAIASACAFDKWSQETLDCIGSQNDARKCLDQLSEQQRAALDTKLTAWTSIYEGESWDTAEDERAAHQPAPISCAAVITTSNVITVVPTLRLQTEELSFAATARRTAMVALCEHWPHEVRACIQDSSTINGCRSKLDGAQEAALAGKLAAIDALMTKIEAAKKKPAASYECKAVVASHYSDAAWKGKAEPPKNPKATRAELAKQAADRKAMIADSRKAMTDACTSEAWSATLRACELVEGGELCAQGHGRGVARWRYPAIGLFARTGIPECDLYAQAIQALQTCNAVPAQARDSIRQGFETMVSSLPNATSDVKRLTAQSCQQGDQALRQAMTRMGCTP